MARSIYLKFRHGTTSQWGTADPVLGAGEPGFESDTGQFKIGDGATAWSALTYAAVSTASGDTRYLLATALAAANGVASLDSLGKLPSSQMPSLRVGKVNSVISQAAMLALAADDDLQFAIRTDISATFILPALADPTVLGNWVQLPMPSTTGLEMQANKDAASGYAGLDAGGLLKVAEFPILDGGTP